MKKLLVLLSLLTLTVSCSRINEGQGGIVTEVDGTISNDVRRSGFEVVILDSLQVVDLTQNIVKVDDISVKDKENINLREFDANITFDTNIDHIVSFYKKTRSITEIKDENEDWDRVLGYNIIKLETVNQLQKTVAMFSSADIASNRDKIESKVKEDLQKSLNERFGEVFTIVNVNINKIVLDESVERSLQLIQVTRNQQLEINAQKEQVKSKKELLDAELQAKSDVVRKYGLTMKEYMEIEIKRDFNKALEKSGANLQLHLSK